jgi:hypothetical protein
VRRAVAAQALLVIWLGSLTPAKARFFLALGRQHRLLVGIRFHNLIMPRGRLGLRRKAGMLRRTAVPGYQNGQWCGSPESFPSPARESACSILG